MILIVAEHAEGKLSKSTYELTEAARQLKREGPVTLFVLGNQVEAVATAAAALGEPLGVGKPPERAIGRSWQSRSCCTSSAICTERAQDARSLGNMFVAPLCLGVLPPN